MSSPSNKSKFKQGCSGMFMGVRRMCGSKRVDSESAEELNGKLLK